MAATGSILKKAAELLFKGLDKILQDAETEAINKQGKLGVRAILHSQYPNEGEEVNDSEFYDIIVDLYGIKGKDKYYCDKVQVLEHFSDEEILPQGSKAFKPAVIDGTEDALHEYVQKTIIDKTYSGRDLGEVLTLDEWESIKNELSDQNQEADEAEEAEEVDEEQVEEPTQSEPEESIEESQQMIASRKLKLTLSPIEGSKEISVSNIHSNYSMIFAAEDIFALVGAPEVAALVNQEPITIEVTQSDDDYDVELVETADDADQIKVTYRLAFDSIMQLFCEACVRDWSQSLSEPGIAPECTVTYASVGFALSNVLKTIVCRMKHLEMDTTFCQNGAAISDAPLNTPVEFLDKAKDILYLLAEDLPDPTVFDREIEDISTGINY